MSIRNVAIIAHVDHGKTTLVDTLLRASKTKLNKELIGTNLIMDSNELEKERGITIFSKNASVNWKSTKINIIDTPGHADFGGEVERVLKMADGALLLIDAKEGPMPQTRFVLKKALDLGLKVIVVINKIDKSDSRINYVLSKTFDLFIELGANEESAYFPIIYSSSKLGKAGFTPDLQSMTDITPVFESILQHIPSPSGDSSLPLQMMVTTISADNFKGKIATGRIYNGKITTGQEIMRIDRNGEMKKFRLTSLATYEGLGKLPATEVNSGDIVAISGIPDITIGETITDVENPQALPVLKIEEPTIKMAFSVNTSPFAGREGEFKTPRQIQDRLYKELETDVALGIETNLSGGWIVSGRGELHIAILIERMLREGYEFQVGKPQVIEKVIDGKKFTPYERVFIEVPEIYAGGVMQKMGERKAELVDMKNESQYGITSFQFIISTKALFGYRSEFITDTKGLGIFNAVFDGFKEDDGQTRPRDKGSLVVHEDGITKLYSLISAQERGTLFIGPGIQVYKGQVIGTNSRSEDIKVNVCKEKQQTNHRSAGEGVSKHFDSPRIMSLEEALEYIDDTELVEVTPKNIRMRKIDLNSK